MNTNYTEAVELAHKVIIVADDEISRGMPNPTCGMTCYRLAVALLHAEYMRGHTTDTDESR